MTEKRSSWYTPEEREERRTFLEERQKTGVGASDIPRLLGGQAVEIYDSKTRPITEDDVDDGEQSIHLFRGNVLEPIAIAMFFRITGLKGRRERRQFTHPDYPGASCSADGTGYKGEEGERGTGTLEVKAPGWRMFRNLVDLGTTEAIILQVQHAIAVRRLDWGALIFVTLEHPAGPIIPVEIEAQPDLGEFLMETSAEFWHRHVLSRVRPDPAEWAELMKKAPRIRKRPLWERNDKLHVLTDPEAELLIRQRCEIDELLRTGKDAKEDVTDRLAGLLLSRYPGVDKFDIPGIAKCTRVRSRTAGGFDRTLLASHRPIDRDALTRKLMERGLSVEEADEFVVGLDLDLSMFLRPGHEYDYLKLTPAKTKEE